MAKLWNYVYFEGGLFRVEGHLFALCLTVPSLCPQSDVVQQSVYHLVHTDDRETFRRQLQFSVGADSDLRAESKNSTCAHLLLFQSAVMLTEVTAPRPAWKVCTGSCPANLNKDVYNLVGLGFLLPTNY